MTLYLVAAYIRLHPNKATESVGIPLAVLLATGALACLSVVSMDYVFQGKAYHFVSDSHKIFAFLVSLSAFLLFKNLDLGASKAVNGIASTVFGVLMIHANSDAMRTFLWRDLLKVPRMCAASPGLLFLHAVLSMLGVFVVCSLLDAIRIRLLEKPLLKRLYAFVDRLNIPSQ